MMLTSLTEFLQWIGMMVVATPFWLYWSLTHEPRGTEVLDNGARLGLSDEGGPVGGRGGGSSGSHSFGNDFSNSDFMDEAGE